jgi:hypothetical protein
MKIALGSLAVLLSSAASAESVREPALAPAEKARIEQTLREIRDSQDITEEQYQKSISFLNDSQCEAIDRAFTDADKSRWSSEIAQHKHFTGAEAVQSFRTDAWSIIYVTFPNAEPAYLFYSGSKKITVWGGGATIFDAPEIEQWALEHAPGLPKALAHCFSWHVTYNRDM